MNPYTVTVAMQYYPDTGGSPISAVVFIADARNAIESKQVEEYIKSRIMMPPLNLSALSPSHLQRTGDRISSEVQSKFGVECHATTPGAVCSILYGRDHPLAGGGE